MAGIRAGGQRLGGQRLPHLKAVPGNLAVSTPQLFLDMLHMIAYIYIYILQCIGIVT